MRTILLTLIGCLLAWPAAARAAAAPLLTVQHKFAAFNAHDASAIEALYAAAALLHSPDHPQLAGNQPIAATYRSLFSAIPDAQDEITRLDVVADRVYAQFVLTGHLGGAADKPVRVRIISVYTVRNGHIVEDNTYYDRKIP
jgi:ketosteroid isomerase-like protein